MISRLAIWAAISFVGLAGCASSPSGPVKALPAEFVDAALEAAMAETIAEECQSLRYNTELEERVLTTYAIRLAAAGYTQRDLEYGAKQLENDPENYKKAIKMIEDRDIDVGREASWCAAGYQEIVEGTSLGRYLLRG